MYLSLQNTIGYEIQATDGSIGTVKDYLFDDLTWVVRYVVVEAGNWINSNQVLLVPGDVNLDEIKGNTIASGLTRQKIQDSPPVESDLPVSRRSEELLSRYYGWTPWYSNDVIPEDIARNVKLEAGTEDREAMEAYTRSHLRSMREVCGYGIHAEDGKFGQLEDIIIDASNRTIRALRIDTRKWLPSRDVVLSPFWIDRFDWANNEVHVDLSTAAVKSAPICQDAESLTPQVEKDMYEHFGRPNPWDSSPLNKQDEA